MEAHDDDTGSDSSRSSDTPSFSFPTLRINDSLASHVSISTTIMRPPLPSRTPSEAASSFGDSSYDIISNAELSEGGLMSDDDTRTESLASFGDNTPDDISVINSAEDSEEEDVSLHTPLDSLVLGNQYTQYSPRSVDEPLVELTPKIGDSAYTSRTVRPTSQSMSNCFFDFYEDDSKNNLVHTIQTLDGTNHTAELSVYGAPYVGVSMHMAVSNERPKQRDVFRLLVVSHASRGHLIEEVAGQIKAALDAHSSNKEGDKGIRMVVEHCVAANSGHDGKREIRLTYQDFTKPVTIRGGGAWIGETPHSLPDLAIFLHTSLAEVPAYEVNQHEVTFDMARLAMTSCSVPIMDLSQYHPLYMAVPHSYACGKKSLHLRVATKQSKNTQEVSREILPVDLDKFFAIEPFTLGKHLSSITQDGPNNTVSLSVWEVRRASIKRAARDGFAKALKLAEPVVALAQNRIQFLGQFEWVDIFLGILVALSAVAICAQVQTYYSSGAIQARSILPVPNSTPIKQSHWVELYSQALSSALEKHPLATVKPEAPVAKAAATPKEIKSTETKPKEVKANAVSNFVEPKPKSKPKIRELDDATNDYKQFSLKISENTILLSPSKRLVKQPKPNVSIKVHKDGRTVDASVKRTAAGAWHIEVNPEQAHGAATLKISGSTQVHNQRKTPFTYEFPVDFGSKTKKPRLITGLGHFVQQEVAVAQNFIQQEVAVAQNGAKELSTRMSTSLTKCYEQSQKLQKDALKRVDDTRKALLSLSSRTTAVSQWNSPLSRFTTGQKNQIKQLKDTRNALQKQTHDLAHQLGMTVRTVQNIALSPYRNAAEMMRTIQTQKWPIKAQDWKPNVAVKRGTTNAKDLVRKLRGKKQETKKGRKGKSSPPIRAAGRGRH